MVAEDPFDALHASLKNSFSSSKYSDLVIRCEGQDFKVHKVVVCGQSDYFASICDGEWKEAQESMIVLMEDDVYAVEAMLKFMYTFDYDDSGKHQERTSFMIFNAEVYSIADKYSILALKARAKKKFDKAVHNCRDMEDLIHAILEVYSSTPSADRGLRDTVVKVVHENISTLLEKDDFRGVLQDTVGFAADVIHRMAQSIQTCICPDC